MASTLVLTPDPLEANGLVQAFARRDIPHEQIRIGVFDCLSVPALDMLVATGGNGKAQFAVQAQYLIDRCDGLDLLACVGAAGRLVEEIQIGDVVVGTATVEHDYKERFNPRPLPRHDANPDVVAEFIGAAKSAVFPFQVHVGVIASGDEDIVDPVRVAELRAETDALCVAWEGSGGARAARLNGVKFIEIRAITDAADADAARHFHDNISQVMFNVVELLLAWTLSRRSAA